MEEFINQDKMFDLIFIDADKKNYKNYFLKSLELLEKDGIIIIDNTLWKGKVFDLNITDDQTLQNCCQHLQLCRPCFQSLLACVDG